MTAIKYSHFNDAFYCSDNLLFDQCKLAEAENTYPASIEWGGENMTCLSCWARRALPPLRHPLCLSNISEVRRVRRVTFA